MVETSAPASRGGRLKYADPRSLPSFPSSGLRPDGAAASAAASLGWSSHKPVEPPRKPDKISTASSAAALLAADPKMSPPLREPSSASASTSAGAKAAMLAAGSASVALKQPASRSPQESWGSSAASQAFNTTRPAPTQRTELSHGSSAANQAFKSSQSLSARRSQPPAPSNTQGDRSLAAAKGAMSSSRPRAASTPSHVAPNDLRRAEMASASSALNGAAMAHRASLKAKVPAEGAGAVSVTTMTRNMFTSHPPVKIETDERDNNEKLHQEAVNMAKKMYMHQQKMLDQAKVAHKEGQEAPQPSPYLNLQDAAYKQAHERLAKLQGDNQKQRDYQEYYGNPVSPRRRFSVSAKLRRRHSDDDMVHDHKQSEKIREQMSMFSNKLTEVDQSKRRQDRDALMAAAQRNVKARLQGMDEKVYNETGRSNTSRVSEWELKAQQTAQSRQDFRNKNKGKIDIGGGKFMDPDEIDAIASQRVQPVLDDINEKAEAERERQAAIKMEEEDRKAEEARKKAREREINQINAQVKAEEKQQERQKRDQEKQEERAKREEQKAARAEEKRQAKEEKRKSKIEPAKDDADRTAAGDDNEAAAAVVAVAVAVPPPHQATGTSSVVSPASPTSPAVDDDTVRTGHERKKSSESGSSPTSKVRGWIKNRFSRGKSMSDQGDKGKSFAGGAALRDAEANPSATSVEDHDASMREVAMAQAEDSRGVSPVDANEGEASTAGVDSELAMQPPKPISDTIVRTSISPNRETRFHEILDR